MKYFINVCEVSDGSAGYHRTSRLYSGDSVEDIKFRIVKGLKDSWRNISDEIDNFENPNDMSLREIANLFSEMIGVDDSYVYDCDIEISNPYTDITEAVKFYNKHLGRKKDFDEADFYSYGDYANVLEKVLPLLSYLVGDYKLHISSNTVERMTNLLK